MLRRPPRFTRTDTLFPYTTLFRSDLHGVQRGALAQVVGDHPDRQAMFHRRIAADAADVDGVLAGTLGRSHVAIAGPVVDHDAARLRRERLARLFLADRPLELDVAGVDRKSTRLNSSH